MENYFLTVDSGWKICPKLLSNDEDTVDCSIIVCNGRLLEYFTIRSIFASLNEVLQSVVEQICFLD